jgi:homoserine dehydrogenase
MDGGHGRTEGRAVRLALIGYGNVGRALARLLERQRARLDARIVAIHTARHGTAYEPSGLPLEPRFGAAAGGVDEFLDRAAADALIEISSLNPATGEPAASHIRAALARGLHVVTANKGPIACAYAELRRMARARGVEFRFEATTMDGTPVYNLVRHTLPGVTIMGFAGALNSTTKLIIEAMRDGLTMEQGIDRARALGITEADPWFDIDGWDSACKAAALANVLMDAHVTPADVDRKGIARITPDKLAALASRGRTVVLVSRGHRTAAGVKLRVRAEVLDRHDVLAAGQGTTNVLTLRTDLMGDIGVYSINPGVDQTAYGLFSDLVDIARPR